MFRGGHTVHDVPWWTHRARCSVVDTPCTTFRGGHTVPHGPPLSGPQSKPEEALPAYRRHPSKARPPNARTDPGARVPRSPTRAHTTRTGSDYFIGSRYPARLLLLAAARCQRHSVPPGARWRVPRKLSPRRPSGSQRLGARLPAPPRRAASGRAAARAERGRTGGREGGPTLTSCGRGFLAAAFPARARRPRRQDLLSALAAPGGGPLDGPPPPLRLAAPRSASQRCRPAPST